MGLAALNKVRQQAIGWPMIRLLPHGGILRRYLLVGAVKTIIDFSAFNVALIGTATPSTAHILLANSIGFLAAVWISYLLNARYTFRAERDRAQFIRYVLVSAAGIALYNGALFAVVELAAPTGMIEVNLAKIAALAASLAWNFIGYHRLVFRVARP